MSYVTFETMENEETTNLAEKSTILDGRRVVVVSSSSSGECGIKTTQPPSWGWGWGLAGG